MHHMDAGKAKTCLGSIELGDFDQPRVPASRRAVKSADSFFLAI
jgi:hypothetical protein